jgi:hypothetical protein
MSEKQMHLTETSLAGLAESSVEPLATLAEGLAHAVGAGGSSLDFNGPPFDEVKDLIASISRQLVADGRNPTVLLDAFVAIDERLAADGAGPLPFATRLAPLALDCVVHAKRESWNEKLDKSLCLRSPILKTDRKTLVAMPVGPLLEEGVALFIDRVLAEVLHKKPKRVVLLLGGLGPSDLSPTVWDALEADLAAQKIVLERQD